jgi:hypothetical protein
VVYFAGDVGRTYWRSGHPDALRLITNALDWLTRGRRPLRVTGEGLVELFAWQTEAGHAVHLLNFNNPNLHRGVFTRHSPIGEQRVEFELSPGTRARRVRLLRAEREVRFEQRDRLLKFTIPGVVDYEVAAIEP